MDDIEQQAKLRDYAFKVLSFRPRSCHEIKQKLDAYSVRKKFPENLVGKVIAELLEKNFLNDEEFALWWKEQRSGQKAKGYRLIKIELQQKGIPSEIIEKVLMQDQKSQEQELASALALVNKKAGYLLICQKMKPKSKSPISLCGAVSTGQLSVR